VLDPTAPTAAGPTTLTATDLATQNGGWGVDLRWPALSGVTTYWVSRKLTNNSDPARYVNVLFVPSLDGTIRAIDPGIDPRQQYTYWVVGYTRNVGETKPSPIAKTATGDPPSEPHDVVVTSVSAPSMLTMPGPLTSISPMLGSAVTLTWTPRPDVYIYKLSYQIDGGVTGVGPVAVRLDVPPGITWRYRTATVNVPQGKTVRLCVDVYRVTKYASDHQNCKAVTVP